MGSPKIPPAPPQTHYSPDQTEEADVAVPIGADGGETVRKRMAASRRRTGRSALQIPLPGGKSIGLNIPQ
jgi:hypothetical protein